MVTLMCAEADNLLFAWNHALTVLSVVEEDDTGIGK